MARNCCAFTKELLEKRDIPVPQAGAFTIKHLYFFFLKWGPQKIRKGDLSRSKRGNFIFGDEIGEMHIDTAINNCCDCLETTEFINSW
jgi:hypothetical protein